jgi:hypothetical protein
VKKNSPPGFGLNDTEDPPEYGDYGGGGAFGTQEEADAMPAEDLPAEEFIPEDELADEPQMAGSESPLGDGPSEIKPEPADEPVAEDTPADMPQNVDDLTPPVDQPSDPSAGNSGDSGQPKTGKDDKDQPDKPRGDSPKGTKPGKELGTTDPTTIEPPPKGKTSDTGDNSKPKTPTTITPTKNSDGGETGSTAPLGPKWITPGGSAIINYGNKPSNPYDANRPGIKSGDVIIQQNPTIIGERAIDPKTGRTIEPSAVGIGIAVGGAKASAPPSNDPPSAPKGQNKPSGSILDTMDRVEKKLKSDTQSSGEKPGASKKSPSTGK